MRCPNCDTENRAGRRFCTQCGGALARVCPVCGAAADEADRFCGECGATFSTGPSPGPTRTGLPSPPREAPGTERRHVSVLFADLVGFTALSLQRDAEDVRDLLSGYFATSRSIIERYGGTVEKFIGDAVMAVWGVPLAQEDDAERAVRAALDLVDAVRAFGEEAGAPELRARAGVLTGEVAVNLGVTGEGMVAGDLVNTASRVQSAAEPDTVYVGEATRRATEAAIEYVDTGEHQLKGKPKPERLWQARRVVAARRGSMRPTGLEPPFTGRERELRLLKEYVHATSEERRARLLSIVGVAGVGKSRLAWEFEKYVDGLTEEVLWHRGRCLSYGEGVTYWALVEMLRMRCGIVENERPEDARQKLRSTVDEYVADPEERRWVEPRLAHLLGLEEGSASDPRDLFAAWRFFLERLAANFLTVLVFEDLQWADSGLFDFIEYLLEWSRSSRILVITLARPEVGERRPGWGVGKRGLTSLYLEPLQPEAMEGLLTGMVPGLPADLRARILERAAGIPLYAVETVRMLLDRGLLVDAGGTFEVRGSLEDLEVPESLHAMIAARLDGLPADQRRLLQNAAVLGKSFTPSALAAVSGQPQAEVEAVLQQLAAKDMLGIESDPRSPERGQYTFVQDLVRSVAEGTLSRRERKLLHLAAADHLGSVWSDEEEISEVVALHLAAAYESDPSASDAPEIRERARAALVRAAEHAASLAAATAALRYYEQALALGVDGESAALLHERAGDAAMQVTRNDAAHQHLAAARLLHMERHDLTGEVRVAVREALLGVREGHFDAVTASLRQAMDALAQTRDDDGERDAILAEASVTLAINLYYTGEFDSAMQHLEQGLGLAERRNLLEHLVTGLDTKSWLLMSQQRPREAMLLQEGALNAAVAAGLVGSASRIGANLAECLQEADRLEESIERAQQAEDAGNRGGEAFASIYAYLQRISALLELGRWDDCEALWRRFEEEDKPRGSMETQLLPLVLSTVWLHLGRGQPDRAQARIEDAEALGERGQEPGIEVELALAAAHAAVHNFEGSHREALESAQRVFQLASHKSFPIVERKALIEALDAAFALGDEGTIDELMTFARERFRPGSQPSIDAHLLRWEARLEAMRGKEDEAAAKFRSAIDAFTSLTRPFWTAVTRLEYAEWLAALDREEEAKVEALDARAAFDSLQASPWVARADTVLTMRAIAAAR